MQRHTYRSEHWYVLKGECLIKTEWDNRLEKQTINTNQTYTIDKTVWHQGCNETTEPCHVLEVQYGEKCIEEDIERK